MSVYSPITVDNEWFCGEKKVFRFTTYADDELSVIQPITGWALRWELRVDEPDTDAVLTKTTVSGVIITDGPNGVCEVTINASETTSLDSGTYAHALMRTDTNNEAMLAHGPALLQQAATR